MSHAPIHIVLLWHSFQSGNLGVGALSISNVQLVEAACKEAGLKPHFSVIGHAGPCDYRCSGQTNIRYYTVRSLKGALSRPVLKALNSGDIVIDISEGDSFTDIYGPRRLFKQLFFKVFALILGRPLVLAPQTIGPFDLKLSRALAAAVMRRCRLVCTRDQKSSAMLMACCPEAPHEEFIDVAFALPFERPERYTSGPLRVGLNVSALLFHQAKSGKNRFGLKLKYDDLIADIIALLKTRGIETHLITHVIAPHFPEDDDQEVAGQIHTAHPECILPEPFASPVEAKSYISGLDLLIGSRMHATIAGISSGIAIVPLAYSRKFTGLFETLDYPMVADMQNENHAVVIDKVARALDDIENLESAADAAAKNAQDLLGAYTARLAQLFKAVKPGQ